MKTQKIEATSIKINKDKKGIAFTLSEKDYLLFYITRYKVALESIIESGEIPLKGITREDLKEQKRELEEAFELFNTYLASIEITKGKGIVKYKVGIKEKAIGDIKNREELKTKINKALEGDSIKEILASIIKEKETKETPKRTKIRRSGHYNNQLLKSDFPEERRGPQLKLWDGLTDKMKREIETIGIEKEEAVQKVIEGIRLTAPETKLIDALLQLLHELSERNPDSKNYYTGNLQPKLVEYGDSKVAAPILAFTNYELAKAYKGGGTPSGKTVDNVRETLLSLSSKYFAINYTKETKLKDGRRVKEKIQRFAKIIELLSYEAEITGNDKVEASKISKIIVQLHPIFRDQIETKYIEYPSDITRRTEIAYGSTHISKETLRLRDYLMSQRACKEYTSSLYLEKLYYKLADREMKSYKRTRVAERTTKALETMKALGLLSEYRLDTGKTGEKLVILEIDRDWE